MRLVAAIAHYAEPDWFLERLDRSLDGVVDAVVALDGRWDLMPGDEPASWRSQVEKRDELMQLAADKGDWVLVIDGDEYLEPISGDALRLALAVTDLDVAHITLRTLNRPWPWRELPLMQTVARRIYRAGTRLAGPAHNDYEFAGRMLNGGTRDLLAPSLDLSAVMTINHDNRARPQARDAAAQDYRRARRYTGVEAATV